MSSTKVYPDDELRNVERVDDKKIKTRSCCCSCYSRTNKKAKTWWSSCRRKNKRCCFAFDTFESIFNAALYYYDIYTDVLLLLDFIKYNWFWCSLGSIIFLGFPYLIAIFAVFNVWRKEYYADTWYQNVFRCACIPILPLFFDTQMAFYKIAPYSAEFKVFMGHYEAIHTFSETLSESLPQLGLQMYMIFWCTEHGCDFVKADASTLRNALISSGMSIFYRLIKTYFEKGNKSWCEYPDVFSCL